MGSLSDTFPSFPSPGRQGFILRSVTRLHRPCFLGTTRESATLCTLPRFGFAFAVRFYEILGSIRIPVQEGFPGVRCINLPVSRPTSPQFGSPDIRSRLVTSTRPPSHGHIVGSLFATYTGSASCSLRTPHFWECPCLVGVVLPSGNGGCFTSRSFPGRSVSASCQAHVSFIRKFEFPDEN